MDPRSMYPHFGPSPWTLFLVFLPPPPNPPPPPPPPPPPHTHTHPARKKEIEEGEMNNEHKASKQHPTMYSTVLMTNCM